MKKLLFIILLTLTTFVEAQTLDQHYPKPWVEPNNEELVSIGRTLVKNNITGCGDYQIRQSKEKDGEYYVRCFNGHSYNYYFCWIYSQKATGPYKDDDDQRLINNRKKKR
jgi:hypothetical protein